MLLFDDNEQHPMTNEKGAECGFTSNFKDLQH